MALWVEEQHGLDGAHFIAKQAGRLALAGDTDGVALWRGIAERIEALQAPETGRRC